MNEGEAKNDTAQAVVQQDQGSIDVQVSKAGKVRDRSWGAAKKALLGNVGGFLDALLSYKDYVDAFVVQVCQCHVFC